MMNASYRALSAISLVALTAGAASAETMIVASSVPPAHFLNTHGFEPLMACVTERTGGEVDFSFFPSGQIATATTSLDAINGGLAQMVMITGSNESAKLPLNQVTMLPDMGDTSVEIVAAFRRVMAEDGLLMGELTANRIVPLVVSYLPPYQLGLRGERIETVDDIVGKKIRVAGGGQVFGMTTMGAVPVQLGAGDAYVAMQQGTVDGYTFALTSVIVYNLQEQSGSISTNANFANAQALLAVDQSFLDTLSPDKQAALIDCGVEVEATLAQYLDELNAKLIADFAAAGVDMYEFSPELRAAINAKLEPVAQDYIKRMTDLGLPGQEAYDEYRKALGK